MKLISIGTKMYDVFISYSRKDYVDSSHNVIPGNVVSKIRTLLEENQISYWFDEEGIYSGQNFVEKIVTNIKASHIFLYLSTANANASRWTCKEIASAEELGKYIIPLRIDDSPYNDKVLFRIVDLDYIEYYKNPEKAMKELIVSIKAYLKEIEEEKKRKEKEEEEKREAELKRQEEEKSKRELEERRKREEQERLVAKIRLECTTLNNEETRINLERNKLIVMVEQVQDKAKRNELKSLISTSSPSYQAFKNQIQSLQDNVEKTKQSAMQAKMELNQAKDKLKEKNRPMWKLHFIYGSVITLMLLAGVLCLLFRNPKLNQPVGEPPTPNVLDSMTVDTLVIRPTKVYTITDNQDSIAFALWMEGKEFFNRKQWKEAFTPLSKVAEMGNDSAQSMLGDCYYYGRGIAQDYKKAVFWYRKAADQGNRDAECSMGTCYEYGEGVEKKDINEAIKWYERAAQKGDLDAKKLLKRLKEGV